MITRSDYRNWKDAKRATAVPSFILPGRMVHDLDGGSVRIRRYIYTQPDLYPLRFNVYCTFSELARFAADIRLILAWL